MKEKDKLRTEIEAKLVEFDKSIEKLELEAEREKEKLDIRRQDILEDLRNQRSQIRAKLKEMDQTEDEDAWEKKRRGLESYMKDMDENIRNALGTDTGFF